MARKRDYRSFTPIMSLSVLAAFVMIIPIFVLSNDSGKTVEITQAAPTPTPSPTPFDGTQL